MDGACRLAAAENLQQEGVARVHARRHGETCRQHQRQKHEGHDEIGELLQHVVALGLLAFGELEPQMLPNGGVDMLELAAARRKVLAEMPADKAVAEIDQPVDDKQPGEEEMPAASCGQI